MQAYIILINERKGKRGREGRGRVSYIVIPPPWHVKRFNVGLEGRICRQGRPVNVKHDARCIISKVRGRQKPKEGEFQFVVINLW